MKRHYGLHDSPETVISCFFSENSSDELNSKLKQINDNNHILNTENIRLDAIKSSYQAASERQKEIIGVHQDEELRKYGQIKELEKQVQSVTDVLTIKKVIKLNVKNDINVILQRIQTDWGHFSKKRQRLNPS